MSDPPRSVNSSIRRVLRRRDLAAIARRSRRFSPDPSIATTTAVILYSIHVYGGMHIAVTLSQWQVVIDFLR